MKKLIYNSLLIACMVNFLFVLPGYSQTQFISLDEAIGLAKDNYAALQRDKYALKYSEQLVDAGTKLPAAQIFISSEEFGADGYSGVHSLNVQQNFYLPKYHKTQKDYLNRSIDLSKSKLDLTEIELEKIIGEAYFQLLYAMNEKDLDVEKVAIFNEFLDVTTAALESGETGKIPQLAAKTRLGQALLEQEHTEEKYLIALDLFNQWLGADSIYGALGELKYSEFKLDDSSNNYNVHLGVYEDMIKLYDSKVELEKAKLLPQINTGLKLQSISDQFPLFGYQIGLNVPLFKKAYKAKIDAARTAVDIQKESLRSEKQILDQKIRSLNYKLEHQRHVLNYLKNELEPIVTEQSVVNLEAFKEGEIIYLEYLNSIEELVRVKHQYLEALYEFNMLRIELKYWTGN